jgi:DnaA family protein
MKQLALEFDLAPLPRLANFVPAGNEAALAHISLWVDNPLRAPVPTYLWGDSGCGKTHLLRAAAGELMAQGSAVGWLDASVLMPPAFDSRWDVVCLDDCHLYTAAQQAAAFNWFVNAQTPIEGRARWVLAAGAVPPADLKLREDLRTRLGESDRRAVLRRAADGRGVVLSDDVIDFMLKRFSRDLSSLMQLLDHLDRYAMRTQRAITIPLIKAMLENE